MRFPEISRDVSTSLDMTNNGRPSILIVLLVYEHEISEESERGNERDDVFPADARQDPAARVQRASRRISQKFRDAANCRRRVLQLSAGASSRFVRTGEARRERRRDSGVVLRKRSPPQRRRSFRLEWLYFETRLARSGDAAVGRTKARDGHRWSGGHSVHSGPDRFRRGADQVTSHELGATSDQTFVSTSV